MSWWAWQRRKADPPWGDGTIDWQLKLPMPPAHLCPEGVGGYDGKAGRTACGVAVPEGQDDEVLGWEQTERKCKRCLRAKGNE